MKRAILYARVATREVCERSSSLVGQQEQLENYCELNGIEIIKCYKEFYSGRTFDRPEFMDFLEYAQTNQSNIDLLLFITWDNFSRNATEAVPMILKLRKMNIEPQAIAQPFNWLPIL